MEPKIIRADQLARVDSTKECFIIKGALPRETCAAIREFMDGLSTTFGENERIAGENWRYLVRSNGNFFETFLFNELAQLDFAPLALAYRQLYELYNALGEAADLDFDTEAARPDFHTADRTINPLIFRYFNGRSRFGWHRHDPRAQRFQLLTNLTQPGVDYVAGETLVYMGEGRPDLADPALEERCVVFGDEFEMGDTFSFPYDRWHMVSSPGDVGSARGYRASLLMPLGPRNSSEYPNTYLA